MDTLIYKTKPISELVNLLSDESGSELRPIFNECFRLINNNGDCVYEDSDGVLMHSSIYDLEPTMQAEVSERDRQAKSYDKRLDKRLYKEIIPTQKKINQIARGVVVEYGCGTGRFTTYLAKKCEKVIAIDFSIASLRELQTKLNAEGLFNVLLIQADITQVYLKRESIDCALSFQVYEHIPELWQRQQWLQTIHNTLKSGGVVYMTLYHQDLRRLHQRLPETGFHNGGIFYRFYNSWLIRSEWYGIFGQVQIGYLDLRIPGELRLGIQGWLAGALSTIGSRIWYVRKLAHLIAVQAVKTTPSCVPSHSISYLYNGKTQMQLHSWFQAPIECSSEILKSHFSYEDVPMPDKKKKKGTTTVIDLTLPQEELWNRCRKKFIRLQITRGRRNGIEVRKMYTYGALASMYQEFRKAKSIPIASTDIFAHGTLYGAYYNGKLIAGGVFFENQFVSRAYALMSSRYEDKNMREVVGQANRLIVWEALINAKERGILKFDLGGLNDESNDSLTEFKEAFGGSRKNQFFYVSKARVSIKNFAKLRCWRLERLF